MKKNKYDIFSLVIMLLSIIGTMLVYAKLPDQVPSHWNIRGEIDNYSSKEFIYFTAVLPVILYGAMKFIPKVDPKKESYKKHQKAYDITIFTIILFLIGMHWITMSYSLGYPLDMMKYIKISLGILFIVMGNYMPQIRFNYFFGIRTPWTLSSENVCRKTHIVGGYLYFLIGVIFILSSIFDNSMTFYIAIASIILISLAIILYSYLLYRDEKKYH